MSPNSIGEARRNTLRIERSRRDSIRAENQATASPAEPPKAGYGTARTAAAKARVCVWARNQLVREALCRVLSKLESMEMVAAQQEGVPDPAKLAKESVDVLVLISGDHVQSDLKEIHSIRAFAAKVKILLLGSGKEDGEFLQYVRAGINGFLWRDASPDDLARAIENVYAGKAVCPGELCAALFRSFEIAEPRLPFGSPTQRLGLTRREQQIVPLIAKGFTNKEIANHFCLSEQTVKNHLYRMKHKIGAEDRLSIVQKFRHHGLLL